MPAPHCTTTPPHTVCPGSDSGGDPWVARAQPSTRVHIHRIRRCRSPGVAQLRHWESSDPKATTCEHRNRASEQLPLYRIEVCDDHVGLIVRHDRV
jgi:hypothetical protein